MQAVATWRAIMPHLSGETAQELAKYERRREQAIRALATGTNRPKWWQGLLDFATKEIARLEKQAEAEFAEQMKQRVIQARLEVLEDMREEAYK